MYNIIYNIQLLESDNQAINRILLGLSLTVVILISFNNCHCINFNYSLPTPSLQKASDTACEPSNNCNEFINSSEH